MKKWIEKIITEWLCCHERITDQMPIYEDSIRKIYSGNPQYYCVRCGKIFKTNNHIY